MNPINKIKQSIAFLQTRVGLKMLKDIAWDITRSKTFVLPATSKLGITSVELDLEYWTTNEDNWREILARVYDILKDIVWTAETADCDNRAEFVSSFISLVYNLNSVGRVYCEVYDVTTNKLKYLHWCNLIVDNNGNTFLFDADNGGMFQKITTKNPVMGSIKYNLINVRIG